MIQAISDDLSPDDVERLAQGIGMTTATRPRQLVLTRCFGVETITSCLLAPRIGGWEVETARVPDALFLRHLEDGGLGVAVGTASAYQYELAEIFSAALCRHYPELRPRAAEIDRALHEMIANALVHGNLEVASPQPGLDGFDAYCRALDTALADPSRLARQVEVSARRRGGVVELAVRDHGPGFDAATPPPHHEDTPPRQHGLAIIAAAGRLELRDGGRCAVLHIAIDEPIAIDGHIAIDGAP